MGGRAEAGNARGAMSESEGLKVGMDSPKGDLYVNYRIRGYHFVDLQSYTGVQYFVHHFSARFSFSYL